MKRNAVLLLFSTSLAVTSAFAQRIMFSPREVAAHGTDLPLEDVWEPSIAMNATHAVTAFNVKSRFPAGTRRTGYAMLDRATEIWTEALVPESGGGALFADSFDP